MKTYYKLEPEAAGELGPETIVDTTLHPPIVEKLEYHLQSWLGDCLLETFPVFLVSDKVIDELLHHQLSGFTVEEAKVQPVYPLTTLKPHLKIPEFKWLKVNGIAGVDDVGLKNHNLIVSKAVLKILKRNGLNYCLTEKL